MWFLLDPQEDFGFSVGQAKVDSDVFGLLKKK